MDQTVTAFRAECDDLDAVVADLDDTDWRRDTPARGWTVADQIAHLVWADTVSLAALTDPAAFEPIRAASAADPLGYVNDQALVGARRPPADLLAAWRTSRTTLADALAAADPGTKLPWFGPPMSPRSMATARLMETWAHGVDVCDALGVEREPTDRLRDICHLGVRTRDFAYRLHGLQPPAEGFRVELAGPSGDTWTWGPPESAERITGTAPDFALVVTQRRRVPDTGLRVEGSQAASWMAIAQVFAGAPTALEGSRDGRG